MITKEATVMIIDQGFYPSIQKMFLLKDWWRKDLTAEDMNRIKEAEKEDYRLNVVDPFEVASHLISKYNVMNGINPECGVKRFEVPGYKNIGIYYDVNVQDCPRFNNRHLIFKFNHGYCGVPIAGRIVLIFDFNSLIGHTVDDAIMLDSFDPELHEDLFDELVKDFLELNNEDGNDPRKPHYIAKNIPLSNYFSMFPFCIPPVTELFYNLNY